MRFGFCPSRRLPNLDADECAHHQLDRRCFLSRWQPTGGDGWRRHLHFDEFGNLLELNQRARHELGIGGFLGRWQQTGGDKVHERQSLRCDLHFDELGRKLDPG